MSKRILVTGCREWRNRGVIDQALMEHGPATVVHGGACGADSIAAQCARSWGWPQPELHPAEWWLGLGAGSDRNQKMVDLGADICLAFITQLSTGTWDCIERAEAAGIPVVKYFDMEISK